LQRSASGPPRADRLQKFNRFTDKMPRIPEILAGNQGLPAMATP
jgi:hypothetical protein